MATSTASSEEMVFETIQKLDYPALWEVANLIGVPGNITGTKFGLLKVVLREVTSVKLEGTEIFKKIESLIKSHYKIPNDNQFLYAFDKGMELNKNSFESTCISLPIGTNGKPLAANGRFPNTIGKLMTGKTLATNGEEITNAMICNAVLPIYW